jgi:signal peptidase I|tara:strand:- start:924 stop:1364 length:441 start_codon:yes stop_codon:yes gene_type:complete
MGFLRILNILFLPVYYINAKRFLVIGHCMEPKLREEDSVFISNVYYKLNKIKRNDIIGINNKKKIEIKRIIGMPNDFVLCDGNSISVNGKAIKKNIKKDLQNNVNNFKVKLKESEYFVLGDDYCPQCIDSRKYGPITKNQIIGKVL